MTDESTEAEKQSRRAAQERRDAANVDAYADAKLAEFMVSYGKMKYAAKLLREVGGDSVIVPHTTNLERWMTKIDERADEFVEKAERVKRNAERDRKKSTR